MIIAIKWFILWAPRSIPDYLAPSIIISIHKKVLKSSVEPRSVIVNPKLGQASGVQNLKKLTISVRLRAKYYEMRCEMRPLEMRIRDAPNPIRFISTLACVFLGPPTRSILVPEQLGSHFQVAQETRICAVDEPLPEIAFSGRRIVGQVRNCCVDDIQRPYYYGGSFSFLLVAACFLPSTSKNFTSSRQRLNPQNWVHVFLPHALRE